MSYDENKLEALLKWYRQEVGGKKLVVVLVLKNDGSLVKSLKGSTNLNFDKTQVKSLNTISKMILRRIELDTKLGSFGAGTFDTAEYRFIFCKAGLEHVFITVLNPLSMIDDVFPYTYLAAEKVARVFDGRLVSPVIPKLFSDVKGENLQRKVGSFQKIQAKSPQYAYKLILGGDGAVGKTSMVHRFVEDSFQTDYKSTIGTAIMKKECKFEGLNSSVRFIIWDLAGQDQFMRVRQTYLKNAEAGLLVYDITRRDTFVNIYKWQDEIKASANPTIGLILIGNKADLEQEREVSYEEGEQLAENLGIPFIETSAKTGDNINESFRLLAVKLIKGFFEIQETESIPSLLEKPEEKKILTNKMLQSEFDEIVNSFSLKEQNKLRFWQKLIDKIIERSLQIPKFTDDIVFTYTVGDDHAGVELVLCHIDKIVNDLRFKEIEASKDAITKNFIDEFWYKSAEFIWENNPAATNKRIFLKLNEGGLKDEYQWDQIQVKLVDSMKLFISVFKKYLERFKEEEWNLF